MFEKLKNDDLVITNDKRSILNYLNNSKKLLNIKIMSLKEFKDNYFGYYDEEAIYYLVNKYNYKYDIAKMYLDNFLFDATLKKELEINNLIIKTPLFKQSIKRIVIINTFIEPFIQREIDKYDNIKIGYKNNTIIPKVYEFKTIEDEVNFICISILKLLKKITIDKIFLVNVTDEYLVIINRFFKFYNIPINNLKTKSVYGTITGQNFINNLKELQSVEKALESIEKNDIYNFIVNICNKYAFKKLDDTIIYLIEEEMKRTSINSKKLKNAISICSLDEINNQGHYFILGFNQGSLPKIYKDEDYLNDDIRKKIGLFTSLDKNSNEKIKLQSIITSHSNITLSYKLKSNKEDFYKSNLIDDLKLDVIVESLEEYGYSNMLNKLTLAKKIDRLIKFNEHDQSLDLLYSNYKELPYLAYNNEYKKIDTELFSKYIKDNILLSYSSIDNFYRCSFRYYIANVLRLNKYEENFSAFIGNLFHYILSIAFTNSFDFEYEFNRYIKDKNFSNKELFYLNKLKKDLIYTINTIKEQDKYMSLDNVLYEKKVFINKDRNIKITFMGVIDKMRYSYKDAQTIVAIIDYKTGEPDVDLNNLVYGISMQLPIYLYLAKNTSLQNVKVGGFYLQKIVHNKLNYQYNKDYDKEMRKLYRLDGYSNSDTNILKELDSNYYDSLIIKGMKVSSKGFYPYSKVLDSNEIDRITNIVDNKIENAITDILDTRFDINPKKIGDDLKGCQWCEFRDICYRKDEDIVNLKVQNYKEFLGGEKDA